MGTTMQSGCPRRQAASRDRRLGPGAGIVLSLLAGLLAALAHAPVQAQSIAHASLPVNPSEQQWAFATFGRDIGEAGFAAADLDGDGTVEVVVPSRADEAPYQAYISVYQATTSGYTISRFSHPADGYLSSFAVFDSDGDGAVEIYAGFGDRVEIRDPITFEVTQTMTGSQGLIEKIVLADGDNDGTAEIIAAGFWSTWLFDAGTKQLERRIEHGGYDLEVGDVDGDGLLEMVFSSGQVIQIAAGVTTLEWTLPNADQGTLVALCDVDSDPQTEIFFVSGPSATMRVYDFGVEAPIREIGDWVWAVVVCDVAGGEEPEVVYAEYGVDGDVC